MKGDTENDDPYNASTTIRMDGSYTIYATFESDTLCQNLIGWWILLQVLMLWIKWAIFLKGHAAQEYHGMQDASRLV